MAELLPTGDQEKIPTEKAEIEPSISEQDDENQTVYPNRKALALIMVALYSAIFLVALVRFSAMKGQYSRETATN